jgi:hypothetical protein
VIFKALAFLRPRPVGKKTEMAMDESDGNAHVARNAEGRDSPEEPEDQADAAQEFGREREKGQRRGNVHLLCEEGQGAAEAVAAKPAKDFLRAVSEKHNAKGQAKDGYREIIAGLCELIKHERVLLFVVAPVRGRFVLSPVRGHFVMDPVRRPFVLE